MCERGGLSFLQMSEWKYQICVMLDLEYATQFSYFQCQISVLNSEVRLSDCSEAKSTSAHRCWMVSLSVFSSQRRHGPGGINNCLKLWLRVQWVSGQFMSSQCPYNKGYAPLFPHLLVWGLVVLENPIFTFHGQSHRVCRGSVCLVLVWSPELRSLRLGFSGIIFISSSSI